MVEAKLAEIATQITDADGVQTYSEADGVYYVDEIRMYANPGGDEGTDLNVHGGITLAGKSPAPSDSDNVSSQDNSTDVLDDTGEVLTLEIGEYVHFADEEIFAIVNEDDGATIDIYAVIRGGNI